ncbi:MAG: tetratricopeptide repeat protein [Planctomycetota bacterium]
MVNANELSTTLAEARKLIRAGHPAKAAALLQKLPSPAGETEDALALAGSAQFLTGDLNAARSTFERLTQLHPAFAGGWVNLGAVLNKLGEHKKAVEALRRAVQKDSKCADAWFNMGIAQKAMNQSTMAINAWREAIRVKPGMFDAHYNLARIYGELKNLGMARKCVQDALKIRPDSEKALALLAGLQSQQVAARKAESPFGRLVNTEELDRQSVRTSPRVLSATRRQAERELVLDVTKRIRQESRDLVPLLDETLTSSLHRLQRLIRDPLAGNQGEWPLDGFSESVRHVEGKMAVITGGIDELRRFLEQSAN